MRQSEIVNPFKKGPLIILDPSDSEKKWYYNRASKKAFHKRQKRENRFSAIGNLLAKRRSLKKSFKQSYRKLSPMDQGAAVATILLEPKHELTSLAMFLLRDHSPCLGYGDLTFGFAAGVVTKSGKRRGEIMRDLLKRECLPVPLNNSITE